MVFGVILAAAAWGTMFVLRRDGFWTRAALAGGAIGIYAVAIEPTTVGHLFDRRHWVGDLGVGLVSGVVLYGVFWLGEQALVIILPKLAVEVGDLYTVRREDQGLVHAAGAGRSPPRARSCSSGACSSTRPAWPSP